MLSLMSRYASTVQPPTETWSLNFRSSGYIETTLVTEISTHIVGYSGGDLSRDWDRFCVHV
jgi:hypothetical protein